MFINRTVMMKIQSIICFLLITFLGSSQETLTLENAVSIALENNYNIQIAQNNLTKAKLNNHIGNANMLPGISLSAGYNSSNGNVRQETFSGQSLSIDNAKNTSANSGINIEQTLFDGFKMFSLKKQLGKVEDLTDLKYKEEIENMTTQVINAYYEAVAAKKYQKLIEQSIKISNEQYTMILERSKYGRASVIDILNTQVSLAADSTRYLDAQNAVEQSLNYLSFLLGGLPLKSNKLIRSISPNKDLVKNLEAYNSAQNILIQQAELNLEITALDYEIYKSANLPQIYANAGYNLNNSISDFGFANSTNSNSIRFGLTASWSIFQGYKRNIQLKTAQIDQLNQNISLKQISQNVNNDLENAKVAYKGAVNKLSLQDRNLLVYEKQYELTKQLYELGKRTILELNQAQQQLFEAKNSLFIAQKEAKKQEIEILRLSGKLI